MKACANQQIPLTYRGEGSLKTTEDLFEASQVSKLNYLEYVLYDVMHQVMFGHTRLMSCIILESSKTNTPALFL